MILSTPFSRQNRTHQSWTNGFNNHTLPRKPPPEQRAPERPLPGQSAASNGQFERKSSTLNRIDVLKQRQKASIGQQPSSNNGHFLRRNVSSLGHYPVSPNGGATQFNRRVETPIASQIYAPASIASAREFSPMHSHNSSNKHRTLVNGFSHAPLAAHANGFTQPAQHHYAATSVHSAPVSARQDQSLARRSGRESALGNLFGTIRRKAASRFSSGSSNATALTAKERQRSASSLSGRKQQQREPIYANGYLSNIPVPEEKMVAGSRAKPLEADQIYAEGARAIDSNTLPRLIEVELLQDPEQWAEGETRTLIEEESRVRPEFIQLNQILLNWINDELAEQRIIVKDLREDLYDGQVLCKLTECLQRVKLDIVDVTQNEQAQRYKLCTVLSYLNKILALQARWARIRWSVEGIHQKNLCEIIHLLVALAKYYRAPIRLPPGVVVTASTYQKNSHGQLTKRSHQEQLTEPGEGALGPAESAVTSGQLQHSSNGALEARQRDAFDALVEQAPEKLTVVTQTLVKFCNRHLEKINITAGQTLDTEQFSDGLLLVFLISSLEGYFVPLGQLFTTIKRHELRQATKAYQETSLDTLPYIDANNNNNNNNDNNQPEPTGHEFKTALEPNSFINTQPIEKLHNVNLALQLMEEAGFSQIRQQVRPEDLANGDLKAVLRVLYALFSRYKHV